MTLHRPFTSVLIANRGEIAVRIVREAKAAGLRAIAVYSDADKGALHVESADAAVRIGPAPARESYLNVEAILAAAKQTKAEAVHPGYGFLSENPDFAQAVIDAGLVWIGPSAAAIRAMGDKGNAKEIARKAGVPVIPGYDGDDQSDAKLLAEAKKIGWPVLIKAALGGGGRGQRRVMGETDFAEALASARREALSAFASDRMILEKALDNVRHIEVQVFGDAQGNVIHLGERDCSVQRRNQKIIEEAPAPGVSEDLRNRMGTAAVALAKAVNYTNAGTVEYLLDREGNFYFLEMNTRIQVEHPVTEEVTDTNLIKMQFDVAMGKPIALLPHPPKLLLKSVRRTRAFDTPELTDDNYDVLEEAPNQDQVALRGHAIEVRLCAEDPADGFRPQTGRIADLRWGDVRADYIDRGEEGKASVSGHYDSLLVKLIAHAKTREQAREKLIAALELSAFLGIRTNRNFLIDLLKRDAVVKGEVDIRWLEQEPAYAENDVSAHLGSIAAIWLSRTHDVSGWRSTGEPRAIIILRERANTRHFVVNNGQVDNVRLIETIGAEWNDETQARFDVGGAIVHASIYLKDNRIHVHCNGRDALFEDITYAPAEPKGSGGANVIRAPMAGRIVKLMAEPGQSVAKNQVLVILEAMKMEHELRAATDGVVDAVPVKAGDQVAMRQTLVTLKQN